MALATLATLFLVNIATTGDLDRLGRVRARDFLQFYVAGQLVADAGTRHAMYDEDVFLAAQAAVVPIDSANPRYYPLYPPWVAVAFAPIAFLPYSWAAAVWWLLQAGMLYIAGHRLLRRSLIAAEWQRPIALLLAVYLPLWFALLNGQLSPFIVLVLVFGLERWRTANSLRAGVTLGLLAVKPQFGVGLLLWALVRRDLRLIAGMAITTTALALGAAAIAGPEVLVQYGRLLATYADHSELYRYSAAYQHAVAGIVSNLLGPSAKPLAWTLHLMVLATGIGLVVRVFRTTGRWIKQSAPTEIAGTDDRRAVAASLEIVGVVGLTLLAPVHLLVYDLLLTLPAVVALWSVAEATGSQSSRRLGTALFIAGWVAPAYAVIGVSLMPLVWLWILAGVGTVARRVLDPPTVPIRA